MNSILGDGNNQIDYPDGTKMETLSTIETTKTTTALATTTNNNASIDPTDSNNLGPITKKPKARPTPYSKPILLTGDRRSRKKKSITWQSAEKIHKVHYFEYIPDERVNVTRLNNLDQQNDTNASTANAAGGSSSLNANANKLPNAVGGKISNASVDPIRRPISKAEADKCVEYLPWRPLVLIDFTPELPSPGWNSLERSAQAERENYVLGAIDLPGQPSTLDEPDGQPTQGTKPEGAGSNSSINCESSTNDDASSLKIIPLENPEGMFTEYPDMYNSEIVNGVRVPSDNQQPIVPNIAPFCNQQSQLLPNQFQQQLADATQNPFTFQEMSAQFQQQQQPFPFQQQQPFQQTPFANQQQQQFQAAQQQPVPFVDQQSGLTGPIMPWLSYPFNQVNESSHAHLFRRPAT